MESPRPSRRSWLRWLGWSLLALIIILIGVGGWMLYLGASMALKAEKNLHATLFTICLVEQFVHDTGRWPNSWEELRQIKFPSTAPSPQTREISVVRIGGQHGFNWPEEAANIQQCVQIDFQADPHVIANQDVAKFSAIKPIGPYYEYRYYGFVDSLQETLRNTIQPRNQQDKSHSTDK